MSYLINSTIVTRCAFRKLDLTTASAVNSELRELADPTTISCAVTSPSSVTTTYTYAGNTVTRVSTGLYYATFVANAAGTWTVVWTGTGAAAGVGRQLIKVNA